MSHAELMAQHDQMVMNIQAERALEFSQAAAQRQALAARGEEREASTRKAMKAMGLDFSKLDALGAAEEDGQEQRIQALRAQLQIGAQGPAGHLNPASAVAPKGSVVLRPSWSETFSDASPLTESLELSAEAVIPGGGYKKYWNRASGAGSGNFGTGAGSNQTWVEFGAWYRPSENRFYSVVPHFQFRGFYIVRSDDGWFTSKEARIVVSCWTNVYQYGNWKGWNSVNVLDVGNDNIDVNQRFDADRYPYSSFLLGADWAFVRCTIGLHAYARGSGAYALNDYNAGNANYLGVPEISIT